MKLGILSDTHDQVQRIERAIALFNRERVAKVYHLGDWCSPFSVQLFEESQCPVIGIFGNNDGDLYKMVVRKPSNVDLQDRFFVDTVNGKRIALIHGDPKEVAHDLFQSKQYDILLYGHTHVAKIERNEKTLLINPGNLIGPYGDKTEWTPPSVAIYDMETDEARIVTL